jgi:CheY-like chemotaxis protein
MESGNKKIIFYADDDPDDRELLREAFVCYDEIDLITTTNGGQALEYFTTLSLMELSPCLIILDINMPLVNGKEVLIKIRAMDTFKNTPAVLFTTSASEEDKQFAKKYNAGFITKPIGLKQMEKIADIFIEHCSEDIRKALRQIH